MDLRSTATAICAVLLLAACSGGSTSTPQQTAASLVKGAPGYCKQLVQLPTGLQAAVSKASLGDASDADRQIIDAAVQQLRTAASSNAPANLKPVLAQAASVLTKVRNGQQFDPQEANALNQLGEAVSKACSDG